MTKRGRRPGVTLVELVVTLVILGVVATVATPAVAPLTTARGNAVAEAGRRVRTEAIREGVPATQVVIAGAKRITVSAWPSGLVLIDTTDASAAAPARDCNARR